MKGPVAELRSLHVVSEQSGSPIVQDVNLPVNRGEVVGLVGESGSGKTTAALALLGELRSGMKCVAGQALVAGADMLRAPTGDRRRVLQGVVSYVPQSAGFALDPSLRIEQQMIRRAPGAKFADRQANVRQALETVALPDPDVVARRYPHQLSGGQQQRVVIAAAFLSKPEFVVLDEPTTGLDVTTQAQVLELLRRMCSESGAGALFISHDLGAVGELCDSVAVMSSGQLVESGHVKAVLGSPVHDYTRTLIDSVPAFFVRGDPLPSESASTPQAVAASTNDVPSLEVREVSAAYRGHTVLENISFKLKRGQTVGVVGESGSGKSTLSRVIAGLHSEKGGEVRLAGSELAAHASKRSLKELHEIQYVFQNPYDSLNPRHDVASLLTRPPKHFRKTLDRQYTVDELLDLVSLPRSMRHRRAGELSGGERQRVAIARAVALSPKVLLCDEITSSLDVTVQASVLRLLKDIQRELGMSMLFVTHNMAVVRQVANEVVILKDGRIVESGDAESVFGRPEEDYTRSLLADVPDLWRTIESWFEHGSLEDSL